MPRLDKFLIVNGGNSIIISFFNGEVKSDMFMVSIPDSIITCYEDLVIVLKNCSKRANELKIITDCEYYRLLGFCNSQL